MLDAMSQSAFGNRFLAACVTAMRLLGPEIYVGIIQVDLFIGFLMRYFSKAGIRLPFTGHFSTRAA